MKHMSKDIYSDWDSPHTFCQYQIDDAKDGLLCTDKLLGDAVFEDAVFEDIDNDNDEDKYKPSECKCPFSEDTATECEMFVYHKNNKNPDAKRDVQKREDAIANLTPKFKKELNKVMLSYLGDWDLEKKEKKPQGWKRKF